MIIDYINLDCLALQLALPKAYLKRLVDAGKLPFIDTGNGRLRFQEKAVRAALAELEKDRPEPDRIQALSSHLRSAIGLITQEGGRITEAADG